LTELGDTWRHLLYYPLLPDLWRYVLAHAYVEKRLKRRLGLQLGAKQQRQRGRDVL